MEQKLCLIWYQNDLKSKNYICLLFPIINSVLYVNGMFLQLWDIQCLVAPDSIAEWKAS